MIKNIPTYKVKVNPDDASGVYAISLVDEGAIEVDFIKLAKEIIEFEFAANKDKQLLYGPLLIPNKLIFRRDNKGNEFNIMFDEEVIQIIADKYNENKLNDVFNFQHSDKQVNAVLLQNWITGGVDKSQEYGFELPKGTWFGAVKVKDESFWLSDVKTGKVNGFSVEISTSGLELVHLNNNKIKLQTMEIKLKDGSSIYAEADLALDMAVFSDDAMTTPVVDGDYELEDGRTISVMDGKVAELSTPAEETQDSTEDMSEELAAPADAAPADNAPALDQQAIMDIVAPMFEEMRAVNGELMAKIAELESKIGELESANGAVAGNYEALSTQVELLAKTPAVESVAKKSDIKNDLMMSKIKAFTSR